uniref:Uncharacterized protein n=1 Tax=Leersia perrieri TaxID=77586 RepID=A0A0D9Y1S0_9ORYZ
MSNANTWLEKKPARELTTDDSPLCHCRGSQSEGREEVVVVVVACRVAVVDVAETKTATIAAVVRKMTPKSRCSQTVEDEQSHRVCQTHGRLGTNAHNGVANTV